jgi:hypothetical protein
VTFADSVLHLVRAGARIDPWNRPDAADSPDDQALAREESRAGEAVLAEALPDRSDMELAAAAAGAGAEAAGEMATATLHEFEPGLGDLEAAVGLVAAGLASRVILSGFPSWPGLLWRAYQLAETSGVLILPTVVRPGGRVDIVITRETAANG